MEKSKDGSVDRQKTEFVSVPLEGEVDQDHPALHLNDGNKQGQRIAPWKQRRVVRCRSCSSCVASFKDRRPGKGAETSERHLQVAAGGLTRTLQHHLAAALTRYSCARRAERREEKRRKGEEKKSHRLVDSGALIQAQNNAGRSHNEGC